MGRSILWLEGLDKVVYISMVTQLDSNFFTTDHPSPIISAAKVESLSTIKFQLLHNGSPLTLSTRANSVISQFVDLAPALLLAKDP